VTVEQPDVIDFISLAQDGERVILTIADHLDWADGEGHARVLQRKIYRYLDFVHSGELLLKYPKAAGRRVVISIRAREPASAYCERFLEHARQVAAAEDCVVEYRYEAA
jgi:hypothetical protein